MLKAAQAYLKTQINTTSQGEILLMLYDGAIKFLVQAKERMQAKDYAQKGILISKALDVIAELDGSLNAEKGGELAQNLHKLYFYCNTRLLRANLEMNDSYVDEVIKIMEAMRNAFKEITQIEGAMGEGPAKSPAEDVYVASKPTPDETDETDADAVRAYGPSDMAAEPAVADDSLDMGPEGEPDPDEPGDEVPQAQLQDVPTRHANLRMVSKLKAYHRAGG